MCANHPYADYAEIYLAAGLRVFPTNGTDGKKPCILGWQRVGRRGGRELIPKFPDANIAIIDGDPGGITRIDIDDPALVSYALDRFGDTPVKVGTPSDGLHLWFRSNGERRKIGLDGMRIDLLGQGGYGLAPPSINPLKGIYGFLEGHPGLIGELPTIRSGALCEDTQKTEPVSQTSPNPKPPSEMRDGDGRNDALFRVALLEAVAAQTLDELRFILLARNQAFSEPLPAAEVVKIAGSVMRYKEKDRLYPPGCEARAYLSPSEWEEMGGNGDAALLLLKLRMAHGWRKGGAFALANALAGVIGWGLPRFRKARGFLVEKGFIRCIHRGGAGPSDPPLYCLLRR